jgi:hypothetical protein
MAEETDFWDTWNAGTTPRRCAHQPPKPTSEEHGIDLQVREEAWLDIVENPKINSPSREVFIHFQQ